jgi:hypothetical protein
VAEEVSLDYSLDTGGSDVPPASRPYRRPDDDQSFSVIVGVEDEIIRITDFARLSYAANVANRRVIEEATYAILREFELPVQFHPAVLDAVAEGLNRSGVPAIIKDVRHGSWMLETSLTAADLLAFLATALSARVIGPTVEDVFKQTGMAELLRRFLAMKIWSEVLKRSAPIAAEAARAAGLSLIALREIDFEFRSAVLEIKLHVKDYREETAPIPHSTPQGQSVTKKAKKKRRR